MERVRFLFENSLTTAFICKSIFHIILLLDAALKETDITLVVFGTQGSTEPISLWAPNDEWKEVPEEEEETEDTPRKGRSRHSTVLSQSSNARELKKN